MDGYRVLLSVFTPSRPPGAGRLLCYMITLYIPYLCVRMCARTVLLFVFHLCLFRKGALLDGWLVSGYNDVLGLDIEMPP